MEKNKLIELKNIFDEYVHYTEDNVEYWLARELQLLLGYTEWRNFENTIAKAKESCKSSNIPVSDHFVDSNKIVEAGATTKPIKDYMLTRYACYLIAQNGDPKKEEIAFAQSYFAIQTRKLELIEERIQYIQRSEARDKLKLAEKRLSQNIYERGVDDKGFGRDMLVQRGITPENLPPSEDMKKLERKVIRTEKQLVKDSGKLKNKPE